MSLDVDIEARAGRFELSAAFSAPGGVTALFGRSGAGKSTLLKLIAGLLTPERGRIAAGGEAFFDAEAGIDVPTHRRRVGVVFQDARLFPHLSVRSNLRYGIWAGRRRDRGRFDEVVGLLGIGPLLGRRPGLLSGGERQRVAIGRALLADPAVLLLDEPLASLDRERRLEILPYLEALRDEAGLPVVLVSHDVDEVARLADTLVFLDQGRVTASGPIEAMMARAEIARAAGRGELGALLAGRIVEDGAGAGLGAIEIGEGMRIVAPCAHVPRGASVRLRIKASDVAIALERPQRTSIRNVLAATIRERTDGAATSSLVLDVAGHALRSEITRLSAEELRLRPGDRVFAIVKSVSITGIGDMGA